MTRHSIDAGDLPPPKAVTFGQRLAYWRTVALWEGVARLPERLAQRLPARAGALWHRVAPARQRAQVHANLRRVVPDASSGDLDQLVRDAYVSYARYWVDAFRLHRIDAARLAEATVGEGLEHGDAIRDAQRGGIFLTAHLGSWDAGAMFTSHRGWGMVVVAEVVEPRPLYERFVRLRRAAGVEVVPLLRGGGSMGRLERRIVDERGLATLLCDRDLTRRGPIVEFFGEPCRLPAGPVVLARRTGRPVIAGAFLTDGGGYRGLVRPPVDLAEHSILEGTQVVAAELEALVRRAPEQWHVFVPNWLADREPDHPVSLAFRRGEDWRTLARSERRTYLRR